MRMENCLPNFSYSDEIFKKAQKFFLSFMKVLLTQVHEII